MEKQKWRLLEVVEENELLHAQLKRNVIDDIVRTAAVPLTSLSTPVISMPSAAVSMPTQAQPIQFSQQKWHTELVNSLSYRHVAVRITGKSLA